jgi:Family of unknown function (DUF6278)
VRQQWRRWLRGPKHGLARKAIVHGVPRHPGREQLRALLGQYKSLQEWGRLQGFDLDPVPEDLAVLDEAIDRFIEEHGRHTQMSAVESDAGRFLGTVIVSTIHGAHWRLWPNGHPVVRLASGRDLDVIALADDRLRSGQPRLAAVYADAATTDPDNQT